MKTPANIKKLLLTSTAWLFSTALLSFVLLSVVPLNAQDDYPEAASAIVGTSADLEDLIVTLAWSDSVTDDWREIAVFDENDLQIAGQPVWPHPGERGQTIFNNFLHRLPASGFQFSATVRDATGRDVSPRHEFRVVLECPTATEPCQWRTQDGLYTDALAISEPIITVLDALKTRRSSDLLADALEARPDLRGSVFSLAAQLDRLDQQLGFENECVCAWYHYSTHDPDERKYEYIGPGWVGGTGSEKAKARGQGARAHVAGQVRHSPTIHVASATGTSGQTMGISCLKVQGWDAAPWPLLASPDPPPRTIRFPTLEACPDTCLGTIKSSATLTYRLAARVRESALGSGLGAFASVDGFLERDDGSSEPAKRAPWGASLQWPPADTDSEPEDSIHVEVSSDEKIRQLTATLSGTALVALRAEALDAWSFAQACFSGGILLRTKGHADCALQATHEARLSASNGGSRSDDCGEPLIEPWDD